MSEGINRNTPARNTLVQLLAVYTSPESHNAQRHRQTDGQQYDANNRSYCVAVRSAKKERKGKGREGKEWEERKISQNRYICMYL